MTEPGYLIIQDVFSRDDMQRAIEALANAPRTRAGARHVLRVPVVRELAKDQRLAAIARQFLGAKAVPFRATLFDKSSESNWLVPWHQDTALPLATQVRDDAWGPWSMKNGVLYARSPAWALERIVALRVSLDDSGSSNGPLRVLPGSHLHGVLTEGEIERWARETIPVECIAAAGGVVAMRPLLVHASSKVLNDQSRRVLHIEYALSYQLGGGVELATA